jgi:hypothetical protein
MKFDKANVEAAADDTLWLRARGARSESRSAARTPRRVSWVPKRARLSAVKRRHNQPCTRSGYSGGAQNADYAQRTSIGRLATREVALPRARVADAEQCTAVVQVFAPVASRTAPSRGLSAYHTLAHT